MHSRKFYLRVLTKLLMALGVFMLAWPFISSLRSGSETADNRDYWQGPFKLTDPAVSKLQKILLTRPPGEVWVLHDPSETTGWRVLVPIVPARGCRIEEIYKETRLTGFRDRCSGQEYRLDGSATRIGVAKLPVPPHRIRQTNRLEVGTWQPLP